MRKLPDMRGAVRAVWGGLAPLVLAFSLGAQTGPVLRGRVEDALSRAPVPGALVMPRGALAGVYTDSLGAFTVQLYAQGLASIRVERLGYFSQWFDLVGRAPESVYVLPLEPSPIALAGIEAVDVPPLMTLLRNLEGRRRSYEYAVTALDRTYLGRFSGASVFQAVRTKSPWLRQCNGDPFQLCVPNNRARSSFRRSNPEREITVCVDGWKSLGSLSDLELLPTEDVALVEIYGGVFAQQVRVYTARWMLAQAREGRTRVLPLIMGCG